MLTKTSPVIIGDIHIGIKKRTRHFPHVEYSEEHREGRTWEFVFYLIHCISVDPHYVLRPGLS